jgi:hypothetical protein
MADGGWQLADFGAMLLTNVGHRPTINAIDKNIMINFYSYRL